MFDRRPAEFKLYISPLLLRERPMAMAMTMTVIVTAITNPPTEAQTTITMNSLLSSTLRFPPVSVGSAMYTQTNQCYSMQVTVHVPYYYT